MAGGHEIEKKLINFLLYYFFLQKDLSNKGALKYIPIQERIPIYPLCWCNIK